MPSFRSRTRYGRETFRMPAVPRACHSRRSVRAAPPGSSRCAATPPCVRCVRSSRPPPVSWGIPCPCLLTPFYRPPRGGGTEGKFSPCGFPSLNGDLRRPSGITSEQGGLRSTRLNRGNAAGQNSSEKIGENAIFRELRRIYAALHGSKARVPTLAVHPEEAPWRCICFFRGIVGATRPARRPWFGRNGQGRRGRLSPPWAGIGGRITLNIGTVQPDNPRKGVSQVPGRRLSSFGKGFLPTPTQDLPANVRVRSARRSGATSTRGGRAGGGAEAQRRRRGPADPLSPERGGHP